MIKEQSKKIMMEMLVQLFSPLFTAFVFNILSNKFKPSPFIINIFIVFFSIWFCIALFVFLKRRIVEYKDNKQFKRTAAFVIPYYGDTRETHTVKLDEIKKFRWFLDVRVPLTRKLKDYKNNQYLSVDDIILFNLHGPYCPEDLCEMNEEKTFFGEYKFTCPNCNYEQKSKFNRNTLMRDAIKIIELQKRDEVEKEKIKKI
ncbi:MAG: hypothetical protein KC455_09190 [Carnobacterium sp.]|nr:hypothetical protein [Carnobacterium sp.]